MKLPMIFFLIMITTSGCDESRAPRSFKSLQDQCGDAELDAKIIVSACRDMMALNPKDRYTKVFAAFNQGRVLARDQNFEAALPFYNEAIRLSPKFFEAFALRGVSNGVLNKLPEAIADFRRATELNPKDSASFGNLGTALERAGDIANAIVAYDKAIELDPNDGAARGGRCWTRVISNFDLDAALEDCDVASKGKVDVANAHNSRGLVHYKRGEFEAAVADYDRSISMNPNVASSFYMRAKSRMKLGQEQTSAADLQKAYALEPNIAERYKKYGVQ